MALESYHAFTNIRNHYIITIDILCICFFRARKIGDLFLFVFFFTKFKDVKH